MPKKMYNIEDNPELPAKDHRPLAGYLRIIYSINYHEE
jgi:hypothetical protein